MTDKIWTKAEIRDNMEKSDKWLFRGLTAIFNKQTAEEKRDGQTQEDNGIGFNGADAEILTSYAMQLAERGFLSPKQVAITRKKMLKYSGQLARISNGDV